MAVALFTNNAYSTLAASITSGATTINVATGHGARFPTITGSDFFYATLIDTSNNLEIVKCTARSTDALTVVRAQEGTTARAYAGGDRIELRVTAAAMTAFYAATGTDIPVTDGGTGASSAADARTNLGLGTSAVKNTGTSGDAVPLLNTDNAWSGEQHFTTQTDTSSAGAVTFDFGDGNVTKITLTENITSITLSGTASGGVYEIWITQHASAAKTVTGWPAAVKWPAATAPTISTTGSAVDIVTLRYDGTIYMAAISQDHR